MQLAVRGPATHLPAALLAPRQPGSGSPLSDAVRRAAEAVFRADFSQVRISVVGEAARLGCLAFTQGCHIGFAQGRFAPESPAGRRLLGRELMHVLQQRAGRVSNPFGSGLALVHDPLLEAEAERMGLRFLQAAGTTTAVPGPGRAVAARSVQPFRPGRGPHSRADARNPRAGGARYCVIGGQAVNAYAEPVVSLDLDLALAPGEIERLGTSWARWCRRRSRSA
jgi:hypothetical protein